MAFHVTHRSDQRWSEDQDLPGLRAATLVGADQGSVHLEIRLCELPAGAQVPAHLHPFEESFHVLDGAAEVALGDLAYQVGLATTGSPPSPSRTPGATRARPQFAGWRRARRSHGASATVSASILPRGFTWPAPVGHPRETDPRHRWVGHFSDDDMAPYGPISMPGYHGPNIRSISIRMEVDQLLGAQQHTLFMVEFAPNATKGKAASEHYHPFEEIYYLLGGTALGTLDGTKVRVEAGDLVWLGVNGTHGFINDGDEPVRWLEVQAPVPPPETAFYFPDDWKKLG